MQRRKGNVSCCTQSIRRKLGASTGERTTTVDQKRTKSDLATSKLVYVEWVDAVSDGGWEDNVKVDIHAVKTVGFLIAETKDGICLASTISGDNSNARMHIPKAWIVKRKVIKLETTVSKSKRKKPAEVGKGQDPSEVSGLEFR